MLRPLVLCIAALAAFLVTSLSTAAKVEYVPRVARVLNEDFFPVDPSLIVADGLLKPRSEPYLLEVEVLLRVSELGEEQGFSGAKFDIDVTGDGATFLSNEFGIRPWDPTIQFDCNGPAPGGVDEVFAVNADSGDDLKEIELLINEKVLPTSCTLAQRMSFGQSASGDVFGVTYIELPGTPGARTSLETAAPYDVYLYGADGDPVNMGLIGVGVSSGDYRVVPEPSGWLLLALAGCGIPFFKSRLQG